MYCSEAKELLEEDHYFHILDFFESYKNDSELQEIWKDHFLVKLMRLPENMKFKKVVENSIIIILSLFNDMPADFYGSIGKEIYKIPLSERLQALSYIKGLI